MKIGFIGFGEAAFYISKGLIGEGITDIHAFDVMTTHEIMGEQIKNRAKEASVILRESASEVTQWVDVLFVAVPSSFTMNVCEEIKDKLRPNQLYVDVSASTPDIKQKIWDQVKDTGALFVDAAMLGSLPKDWHKVPITASGNGALKFQTELSPYGMQIQVVGEKPGAASAIKLVRSIYMKGISALMVEMLQAADAYDVTEEVVRSISKSMDKISFESHLERLVTGSALHCIRRAAELKGSIEMLSEAHISAQMAIAAKQRLEEMEPYRFAEKYVKNKPDGWKEIIVEMRKKIK